MNLAALRTELKARGYDFDTDARANQWINDAYQDLCERADFQFLLTTTTGAAPLTISDLRTVSVVRDSTNGRNLEEANPREVRLLDPTHTSTGAPTRWYLSSDTTISVWPVSTPTLEVVYYKVPAALSGDSDTPIIPARYHSLIVDLAELGAQSDISNPDRDIAEQRVERKVQRMIGTLLDRSEEPTYIQVGDSSWDW